MSNTKEKKAVKPYQSKVKLNMTFEDAMKKALSTPLKPKKKDK